MNTLKSKVLLFLSNTALHRAIGQAMLIWIITCVAGCFTLYVLDLLPLLPVESVFLSLAFSSPSLLIAIPFLYRLHSIPTVYFKIVSGAGIILLTSGGIIGFVALFFNLKYPEVAETLLPFIPAALICFVSITRKQLVSKIIYK